MSSPQAALQQVMNHVLADTSRRVYVVLDGARFDDLPLELATARVAHRSLYRNVQDIELVRAGPWLVDPYHGLDAALNVWGGIPMDERGLSPVAADTVLALGENAGSDSTGPVPFHASGGRADPAKQLEQTLAIAGDLPAAVLWIGGSTLTEAALWRHLRTINMAMIPKERGPAAHTAVPANAETHDAFLFRHADGNVLAEVLPVLDAGQFARVFGPARELIFLAPHHPSQSTGSILRRAVLPSDAPTDPAGLLTLSQPQIDEIEDARNLVSRWETVAYLRECAPDETRKLSDAELYIKLDKIEERGFALGFEGMTAHLLFAFLCITGVGDEIDSDEFRQDVADSGLHPDDALNEVYAGMISAAESDARKAV